MDANTFNKIITDRVTKITDLLVNKAAEYAPDADKLINFKNGAAVTGKHPAEVLDGYLLKHYVSYRDIIQDIAAGKAIDYNKLEEKLSDILAYYLILEPLVLETVPNITNLPANFYQWT